MHVSKPLAFLAKSGLPLVAVAVCSFAEVSRGELPLKKLPTPAIRAFDAVPGLRSVIRNKAANIAVDEAGREVVTERYPNRAIKTQRSIKQDAERNYINDGPWTMFDPQGKVIAQGEYANGKRHGDWMRQMEHFAGAEAAFQAPFISQVHFEQGRLHGGWSVIDSQQRIVGSWEFADGVLHGASTLWYPGGQQRQEMHFAEGLPDSEATVWKPDGTILAREFYRAGKQLVPVVTWHDRQQKESEGWTIRSNFEITANIDWWESVVEITRNDTPGEDQRIGKWVEWHPNGSVRYGGEFKAGQPTGQHVWWHENGQRMLVGEFEQGKRAGRWTKWHVNGLKNEEGEYLAGVKEGTWTVWSEAGEVVREEQLFAENSSGEGPELLQPYSHTSLTP